MVKSQRGMALITSLMLLAFLTIVGGALLSTATVDMQIGMNYRTNTQLLFVAEAGIEAAREALRSAVEVKINASAVDAIDTLAEGITEVLKDYDGTDTLMSTSLDVDMLMNSGLTNDIRFADTVAVTSGAVTIGTYTVFVRNDAADGAASNTDANEVVTLVSIGVIGSSEMLIEVDLKKGRFPLPPAALTLDGPVPNNGFRKASSSGYAIKGDDAAGGPSIYSVGVVDNASGVSVMNEVASGPDRSGQYCGRGTTFPVPCDSGANQGPDVKDISGLMDPNMMTVSGLNAMFRAIESNATSNMCPPGSVGSAVSPVIVVVSGDCVISGYATGWGQLVVDGALTMGENVKWNGLIFVLDPARCDTNPSAGTHYAVTLHGGTEINGGLFVASTHGNTLAEACLDTGGEGSGGITYDSEKIRNAAQGLPFRPIAIRHH